VVDCGGLVVAPGFVDLHTHSDRSIFEWPDAASRVLQGVTTEGTSARVFAGAGYTSGGKTGTAQAVTIGQKDRYDAGRLEEHQRDHSLYIAFAPVEAPRVALAVVVENSGFGAAHAAPIARRVFDYLLQGLHPSDEDMAATQKGLSAAPIGTPRRAQDMPWPPSATAPQRGP
jgi:penicillin-binding protein 2